MGFSIKWCSSRESIMGYDLMKKLFCIFKEHLTAPCMRVEHMSTFIDLQKKIRGNGWVQRHLPDHNHGPEIGCDEIKNPMGDERLKVFIYAHTVFQVLGHTDIALSPFQAGFPVPFFRNLFV